MPYIKEEDRKKFEDFLHDCPCPLTAGEFNFLITQLTRKYIANFGESYQVYNDLMGALEGCKLEMYRRRVAPYENKKMNENGDV